jgi:carboxylesterase
MSVEPGPERASAVRPGAEAFTHDGAPVGVLLCHGFTGSPQTLRGWAEYLAEAGLTVSLPRLPGHGTTWQDMARTRAEDWLAEAERAFEELRGKTEETFVMGLSMGACLALRLAELHGDAVRGLVVVNPSIVADSKVFLLMPVLRLLIPSVKGIASDIKQEGSSELGYDRVPVKAAATLPRLWNATQADLGRVSQPVLAYHSTEDHVVGPKSLQLLRETLPPSQLTVRDCENSYHVATLDNDAAAIFAGSLEFVAAHSAHGEELRPPGGEVTPRA